MAATSFNTNSSLTFKQQMSGVFAVEETILNEFVKDGWMGKETNNVFQILPPLKEGGDQMTYPLRMRVVGPPTAGDSTIEGNERSTLYYSDSIKIDQARFGGRIAGRMTQQFTKQKLREDQIASLTEEAASWEIAMMLTMLSGKLGTQTILTDIVGTGFTGWAGNNLVDVDSTHQFYGGDATSKATLDASDKASIAMFVQASTISKTITPKVPSLKIGGKDIKGTALMHPYAIRDLKNAVGENSWSAIERAKLAGGQDFKSNGIIMGSAGIYDGWVIKESELCPIYTDYGAGSVQASRVLFLGAQAGVYLTGMYGDGVEWDYVEKKFDADNQIGFYLGKILGAKPAIFNSKRLAMLACDVAAATT